MAVNVKKIGNYYEKECCKIFAEKGFWVHLLAYNASGQPCDIVAAQSCHTILIDVKHCSSKTFNFSNIQPNQYSTFNLASEKDLSCGFAIYNDELGWKWLDYHYILCNKDKKSVRLEELEDLDICF